MDCIAIINQKGGVGKTTTSINLAGALAERGYRVLLMDLDPQGHLTEACGVAEAEEPVTLARALIGGPPADWSDLIVPWRPVGAQGGVIDILPTSIDMFVIERRLYQERALERRLERLTTSLTATGRWDVLLIDCPPSLGALTDNALYAAGRVLVPVQAEDSTMRALRLLLEQIDSIRDELQIDIEVLGMVVNGYEPRRGLTVTTTLDALKELPLPILATVHDRAAIRYAWRAGQPVVEHAPGSDAAAFYRQLATALTGAADETAAAAGQDAQQPAEVAR